MKKLMMVGLLLTAAIALQAQMKVAPKMEKGAVKTYVGQSTVTMPMQGDVKVNYETKYTIVDATAPPKKPRRVSSSALVLTRKVRFRKSSIATRCSRSSPRGWNPLSISL